MNMRAALCLAAILMSGPALAHHPEGRLDEVMMAKEPAFEATDLRRPPDLALPDLALRDASGGAFDLDQFEDKIVVLSFVPEDCGSPCDEQQALLSRVRDAVNITPMRDMVMFVGITNAGGGGAAASALNLVTVTPAGESTVASLAARFAALSSRSGGGPQAHVIDRRGRHAGIFHGTQFGHVNMILYINGLTNTRPPEPGLWDSLLEAFR